MNQEYIFTPIAIVHSCFKEKFGIPRQPGLAPASTAQLELLPPYNRAEAVDGLEGVSHLWLQFVFHQNTKQEWKPKVRPPRLGGNKSMGVFATRSPIRPNPIGLSVVKLDRIDCSAGKVILHLSGIDLVDGTPILDIKPYVPYADAIDDAQNNFADARPDFIPVKFSEEVERFFTQEDKSLKELVVQVLQQDPRPQYQTPDPERIYGMKLLDFDLRWQYRMEDDGWVIVVIGVVLELAAQ